MLDCEPCLTVDEAEALVKNRTVSAGMLPKIAAIARLIRRGVGSAHIINGNKRNALLYEVFTDIREMQSSWPAERRRWAS